MGVLDTIEGTTSATHSVTLCLDAELQGAWDRAQAKLEVAAKEDVERGSMLMEHTTAVVEEMDSLRDRMLASEVTFEFDTSALPWNKRIALQTKHPPREGNLLDMAKGYNWETFLPELIKATCVAATDANGDRVETIPAKTWAKMFGRLNLGQFEELAEAARHTSDRSPVVPRSARYLLGSRDSVASSTSSSPGKARRRSGGAAGSRRTSPSTTMTPKAG